MAAPIQASPLNPRSPSLDRPKIPPLPLDVLQIINSYADEKTLKNLSQASKDYKKLSLKELNKRSYEDMLGMAKLKRFDGIIEKNSILDVYQKAMKLFLEGTLSEPPVLQNPLALKQTYNALITNHIASSNALDLQRDFYSRIEKNEIQWKDIKDIYFDLQSSCLLKALEHLIPHTDDPADARGAIALYALDAQQLQLFEHLTHGHQITDSYFGDFLIAAASHGNEEIVGFALHNLGDDGADEEAWVNAIVCAAREGHEQILDNLLDYGSDEAFELPDSERGGAVVAAAKNGHLNIITKLMDNSSISKKDLGKAMLEAVKNRHQAVINYLGLFPDMLTEELLSIALIDPPKGLHLGFINHNAEVIETTLKQSSIDEELLINFTSKSAKEGDFACVKAALDQRRDCNRLTASALMFATKYGRMDIVNYILQNRDIERVFLLKAYECAAKANNLDILRLIHSKIQHPLSETLKALVLGHSSCNNNLEMCQFLLQTISFSSTEIQGALFNAIASSHPRIVEELLKTGYIKKQETLLAISMALPRDNQQILNILRAHLLAQNTQ